jgi:hypothetical protein
VTCCAGVVHAFLNTCWLLSVHYLIHTHTPSIPPAPGAPLELRLLLDGSALEIFTGSGETLTTRVYRGTPPAVGSGAGGDASDAGMDVFAAGEGPVLLSRLDVWEMCSGWVGGSGPGAPGGTPASSAPYSHTAVVAPAFLQEALAAGEGEDMLE